MTSNVAGTARRTVLPAAAIVLGLATAASPCGGPLFYPIDAPLVPNGAYESAILSPGEWPDFIEQHPEFLFAYPFRLAGVPGTEALWDLYYEHRGLRYWQEEWAPAQFPLVDGRYELQRLAAAGDTDAAVAEAERVIDTVLGMSSWHADLLQDVLRPAVELVEPPPRTGSMRYLELQQSMATLIPDGWRYEIQQQTPAATWEALERLHDDWLIEFPGHPLGDLIELSKLRLYYLQGDAERAWRLLLDFYPRRRVRVLHEMRFLLAYGGRALRLQTEWLGDLHDLEPLLASAFVPSLSLDEQQWNELWRLSSTSPDAPWSINLQERLLDRARVLPELPSAFPAVAAAPTELWGELRLLILFNRGELAAARDQAALLAPSFGVSSIVAALHLFEGAWTDAVGVEGLDANTRRYLVRVAAPEAALRELAAGDDEDARGDAVRTLAARAAAGGDWPAAAELVAAVDPVRAERWRNAARLAGDRSAEGRLAFGRFLTANHGRLFFGIDTAWQRSLSVRLQGLEDGATRFYAGLPWSPEEEAAAIREHFLATSERYLALEAYADYLDTAVAGDPEARRVLGEADEVYNWLINFEPGFGFWLGELSDGDAARRIRAAGRRIRGD